MVSITSEYGLYLYTGKVDMRKGIDLFWQRVQCLQKISRLARFGEEIRHENLKTDLLEKSPNFNI